jgi:hypothetical protein
MSRVAHRILAAVLITLTLSACRDSVGPPSTLPAVSSEMTTAPDPRRFTEPRIIRADLTDPAIDYEAVNNVQQAEHYVWLAAPGRPDPKLLVFMPGTLNRPIDNQLVQQEAASLGYDVIGLMYQNNVGVDNICRNLVNRPTHPDCSGDTRLEILTGDNYAQSKVDVSPANSIDHRLTALLEYLSDDRKFPGEKWSGYLEVGSDGKRTPKWSQIAVAGQSQGAGQAALIGKLREVARVVMFSGPPDERIPGEVDSWVAIGVTPADRYFALYHENDHLVRGIRANLTALGMQEGFEVKGGAGDWPYGGRHMLSTKLEPHVLDSDPPTPHAGPFAQPFPHRSTARDWFTPLEPGSPDCYWLDEGNAGRINGIPLLRDAWRYMLGGLQSACDGKL